LSFFRLACPAAWAALVLAVPAAAQDGDQEAPDRIRVMLGPQAYPASPGSDDLRVGALVGVDRARGGEPFAFEAADDSFGFHLVRSDGFSVGPVVNWQWSRTAEDVGADLPKVGFSLEAGAFAQYELGDRFRLRAELRKGLSGHDGWIGSAGADAIFRDGDRWLFAIGPRVTWGDDSYNDAYFSVAPAASVTSGLPAYDAGGGIHAIGANATFLTQLSPRWGLYAYAKYDRLTGDAADSPIVRVYGSRDQVSGGLALTYTFDWRR
jgi:outer membrane scaffolding protein for murein synthesis (MipA/OmpV family)